MYAHYFPKLLSSFIFLHVYSSNSCRDKITIQMAFREINTVQMECRRPLVEKWVLEFTILDINRQVVATISNLTKLARNYLCLTLFFFFFLCILKIVFFRKERLAFVNKSLNKALPSSPVKKVGIYNPIIGEDYWSGVVIKDEFWT